MSPLLGGNGVDMLKLRSSGCDESPGGISPPGAPRTVHDPVESHGFRCSKIMNAQSCSDYMGQKGRLSWWPFSFQADVACWPIHFAALRNLIAIGPEYSEIVYIKRSFI